MDDCIFCKIVKGEMPSFKVYENEETFVFMDIAKDVDGHIVVIPKKHYKNILDCDTNTLHEIIDTVKMISNHLTENCGYEGVNLLNASDESAGQSVQHFHIHIIPRKKNDGIDAWPNFDGAKHTIEEIYEKIVLQLGMNKDILEKFEFRNIKQGEKEQAVIIEQVCFPPNEACSEQNMIERIAAAQELFLAAVDKKTGKIAGFLNGIATDECCFRDEFFTDAGLHNPAGRNVMLLGLDVLPEYRGQGLGRELVYQYLKREREKCRQEVFLTCLKSKVAMYKKFGFTDCGISNSSWGGEEWHEMSCKLEGCILSQMVVT